MAAVIARVTGTALAPGVSRNGRLYTKEAIGKAVTRAQAQIADGKRPITMRSHHAAGDDSLRIIGSVSKLWQDPETGAAMYEGAIADTPAGQTIKALTDDSDGKPAHLKGVSIRGAWMAEPRQQQYEGRAVDTADDLAIFGLDYTADPGVDDADVHHLPAVGDESADTPAFPITESAPEALVSIDSPVPAFFAEMAARSPFPTLNEMRAELGMARVQNVPDEAWEAFKANLAEAAKPLKSGKPAAAPTKAQSHADPGYQPDKAPRYALDTKKQAKAAWSFINQSDNAKDYTPNQLKRIKGRIIKALKKFGVTVTAEHWLVDPAQELTESTTLAECMGYDDGCDSKGSFYVSLTNGPVSVSVSSYVVDPADLDLIGRAAMDGAVKCLATIDPDMDGDMDVPGGGAEDTDGDMGDEPTANVPGTACPCDCGCVIPIDPDAANCLCTCDDCPICGSTSSSADAGETVGPQPTPNADAPTPPITVSVESAPAIDSPAPDPAAETITETEERAVSEPITAAEPTQAAAPTAVPAAPTFTFEQMMALLAAAGRPTESAPAPAAPVVESAPAIPAPAAPAPVPVQPVAPAPVAETQEQMIARLVAEGVANANRTFIQDLAESGALPGRRGLTAASPAATAAGEAATPLAEGYNAYGMPAGAPNKPLHEYTTEELNRWGGPMVFEHAVGHYATRRA